MQRVNFDAAVSAWVKQTQARMTAVFRESAQRVIEEMTTPVGAGGNMPVVTGFLRASLRVSIGGNPLLKTINNPSRAVVAFAPTYSLTLASAKIGDVITAVFIANYAQRIENGFVGTDASGREYNQGGRHFVKLAAQRWPTIVRQVCAELRNRNP